MYLLSYYDKNLVPAGSIVFLYILIDNIEDPIEEYFEPLSVLIFHPLIIRIFFYIKNIITI